MRRKLMHWVCEICGYVHDEDERPLSCPVCGAPKNRFVERDSDDPLISGDESFDDDFDHFENDLYGDLDD